MSTVTVTPNGFRAVLYIYQGFMLDTYPCMNLWDLAVVGSGVNQTVSWSGYLGLGEFQVVVATYSSGETGTFTGTITAPGAIGSPLQAYYQCNGNNLDVVITLGDEPFTISWGGLAGSPRTGLPIGTHTLTGPGTWTDITITENGGDGEVWDLSGFACPPWLRINDRTINEGSTGGTTNYELYVGLYDPAPAGGTTFDICTSDGTATTADGDYTSVCLTGQTIPAGQMSYTFTVPVAADYKYEPDEYFLVDVTNITGATLKDGHAVANITNDDPKPKVNLSLSSSTLAENGGTATVTATLTNPSYQDITVNLDYTGTASYPSEYTRSGASIFIPSGSTSGSISLASIDDLVDEPNETIITTISSLTNADMGTTTQVTATIADDDLPTVTLNLTGGPLAETGGTATLTATLSNQAYETATINLGYTGTATRSTDYNANTSIVIPVGSSSGSITIASTDDATDEPDETLIVDITSATGALESGVQQKSATILDDDLPTVTLSLTDSPLDEDGGVATVTVTLSNQAYEDATINLGFTGAATNTSDYTRSAVSVFIPIGSSSATVNLTSVDDAIDEPHETIIVDITTTDKATEDGTQQVTATITDDDLPTVTLSVSGSPATEAGGVATVTATLSNPAYEDATITLSLSGAATESTDYTASGTVIAISTGETSGSITLTSIDDAIDEPDETIIAHITTTTKAVEVGTQQVTATILDNDVPTVTLSLADSPMAEDGGIATVTATLSNAAVEAATINLSLAGTATSGSDYTASNTVIIIPTGSTSGSITLTGIDDPGDEPHETIIVNITSTINALESSTQQVTATITDDDLPTVTLSMSGSPATEAGGIATVTATLSNPAYEDATINLSLGGTATEGTDYTASGTVIAIPIGETSSSVTLTSVDDATDEPNETIIVAITSTTKAVEIGTQQVTVIIEDDDVPTVTLSASTVSFAENESVTITATLSNAAVEAATVNLSLAGTATQDSDYTAPGTVITVPVGSTNSSIILTGVDDLTDEPHETIIVDITTTNEATEDGTQQVTLTLLDNDPPLVSLSLTGSPLAEDGGTATVTATLSNTDASNVRVNLSYSGTASISDFVPAMFITIPSGSLSASVLLTGSNDLIDEPEETVVIDIASVVGGVENGAQQVTAVITDDDLPTVTLSLSGSPLDEAGGVATVTATLSNPAYENATVNLGLTGTAADVSDYTASGTMITIPTGETSGSITLTGVDDLTDEPDETVIVDITGTTKTTESGTQQVIATIADDDVPMVTLSLSGSPLAEAGGVATVTATLSNAAYEDAIINLSLTGTGTGVADYTASSTVIFILAGSTSNSITLTGVDDPGDEPDETIIVDIASTTEATESGTQQVTAVITDDDLPTVTLSLADSPLAETGGAATVTATLSNPAYEDATVTLGLTGTATDVSDYTASGMVIAIPTGETSGSITLTGMHDVSDEPDETVIVDITGTTKATESGIQQVTAIITDDDVPTVTLSLSGSPLDEAGGVATITATLSNTAYVNTAITLEFTGTATIGSDYTASNTVISIPVGSTSGSITLTGVNDPGDEPDETIIVDIVSTTAATEPSMQQVTATITDNDATPGVSINDVRVTEGHSGTVDAVFTVSLSSVSYQTVEVSYATADDTATIADNDYQATSGILTFAPDDTSETITVTIIGDTQDEGLDERFLVTLSNPVLATLSDDQGIGTIANDDISVGISINDVSVVETNNQTVNAIFTVSLSSAYSLPITVNYATANVTARSGFDFTRTTGILTFDPGEISQTISVPVLDDTLAENDETFVVNLTNPQFAFLADDQGEGTITGKIPQLLRPINGAETQDLTPRFRWQPVDGATTYRLQVDNNADFSSLVINVAQSETLFAPTDLLPNNRHYYWRVRAYGADGVWSGWSEVWRVHVEAEITPVPDLISPTNDILARDAMPTFRWEAVTGAANYLVQIDNNADFSSPVANVQQVGTTYTPTTALNDDQYYWRVRARGTNGLWSGWSSVWNLVIDTQAPARPVLIAPANDSVIHDNTPTFTWRASTGANRYSLQVDNNPDFSSPIINVTIGITSYTPVIALDNWMYHWRVLARDAAGNTIGWTASHDFLITDIRPATRHTPTPRVTIAPTKTKVPATLAPTSTETTVPTLIPTEVQGQILQWVESNHPAVLQSGSWTTYNSAAASGGNYLYSGGSFDDTLSLAFTGTQVSIAYVKHPALGTFAIEIDGTVLQTVNSVAAESVFGAQAVVTGLADGLHTLKLYPVAGVVALDAFGVEALGDVPVQTPTATNTPTQEIIPTETTVPPIPTEPSTDIPLPTDPPTDVPTETPLPTATPTDIPSETPVPSDTPMPSATPTDIPTETPVPTEVPVEIPPLDVTEEPAS